MKICISLFEISEEIRNDQVKLQNFKDIYGEPNQKYLEFDTGTQFDDLSESTQENLEKSISRSIKQFLTFLFISIYLDWRYEKPVSFAGCKAIDDALKMLGEKLYNMQLISNSYSEQ